MKRTLRNGATPITAVRNAAGAVYVLATFKGGPRTEYVTWRVGPGGDFYNGMYVATLAEGFSDLLQRAGWDGEGSLYKVEGLEPIDPMELCRDVIIPLH